MWLITLCLVAKPYLCQDQIRYGLYDSAQECAARMNYSDVRRRILKYSGKVSGKCIEVPVEKMT